MRRSQAPPLSLLNFFPPVVYASSYSTATKMTKRKFRPCPACQVLNQANRKSCSACYTSLSKKKRVKDMRDHINDEWALGIRQNRNAAREVSSAQIAVQKLAVLGYMPILFIARKQRHTWVADITAGMPISDDVQPFVEAMKKTYEYILKKQGPQTSQPQPQTDPLPDQLPQTDPLPDQLPQTNPLPDQLTQTAPLPDQLPQTAPLPDQLTQTNPLPDQLTQTNPLPDQLTQTAPLPDQLTQTAPLPDQLPQTAPLPDQLTQTNPLPDQLTQTNPLPDQLTQTDPLPDQLTQTDALPDQLTQPQVTDDGVILNLFSVPFTPQPEVHTPQPQLSVQPQPKRNKGNKRKKVHHQAQVEPEPQTQLPVQPQIKGKKGCRKCSKQKLWQYDCIMEKRMKADKAEVKVRWLPCSVCGKTWVDTWEPASQFSS